LPSAANTAHKRRALPQKAHTFYRQRNSSEAHGKLTDAAPRRPLTRSSAIRMVQINGKFLLSYNDCPQIRQLYSREGIMIESTTRLSNIAQRYDSGKQYPELLLIGNSE
jgi:hypothetical protein